ncbi:MAG: AI-2E family transporter [Candidatus Nanoarchaeia archaeon]|nr:AI-2E family transporter [Candidatus Nanoarchaeia archaeon]
MKIEKPFLKILLIIVFIATLFLIKNFITLIISCFILSYLIKPLYSWINNIIKNKEASALISELLFFILIMGIFIFIINSVYYQVTNFGSPIISKFINLNESISYLNSSSVLLNLNDDITVQTFNLILEKAKEFTFKTPEMLINILLLIYITFYLIIDSEKILKSLISIIPDNSKKSINSVFLKINNLLKELSFGYFLISIFVMLFSFIFLNFMKMPLAFDYSLISAILSLIPLIGNWIIPIFISLYYIYINNPFKAILMVIFSFFLSYLIKMIRIIVNKNKTIHPILFIIGVIVGFYSFGLLGFIIGPVLFGIIQISIEEVIGRQKNI